MDCTLYLIAKSHGLSDDDFYARLEEAVRSGVSMVELREDNISSFDFYKRAMRVRDICHSYSVPVIISDRVDIALAAGCDGVMLGHDSIPVKRARELMGSTKIIGTNARTIPDASSAQLDGADYFCIGPFFGDDFITTHRVFAVTDSVRIPAVAYGGLNEENLDIIADIGIKGFCVSDLVMQSDNITMTVWQLKRRAAEVIK